jgi:glycosyltransferase involved in cell wall biosynthesis
MKTGIEQPLVSIIVITYNSSKFVLETLESAKAQTYMNIELIISDDCSTDNTVEIIRKWIDENKDRFARTEIITTTMNTGISANCNRGLSNAYGEWVKLIAGDDVLMSNCIKDNVIFIKDKHEISFVFSDGYRIDNIGRILRKIGPPPEKMNLDWKGQFRFILKEMFVPPVSSFIRNSTLKDLGGFCEKTPFIEDHSLYINALRNGNKLYYLPHCTVLYRKHENSTTLMIGEKRLSNKHKIQFARSVVELYDDQYFNDVKKMKLYRTYYHAKLHRLKFKNLIEDNKFIAILIDVLNYIDPIFMIHKLKVFIKIWLKRILLYLIYQTIVGKYLIKNKVKLPCSLLPA